jgi:hypothetical protein
MHTVVWQQCTHWLGINPLIFGGPCHHCSSRYVFSGTHVSIPVMCMLCLQKGMLCIQKGSYSGSLDLCLACALFPDPVHSLHRGCRCFCVTGSLHAWLAEYSMHPAWPLHVVNHALLHVLCCCSQAERGSRGAGQRAHNGRTTRKDCLGLSQEAWPSSGPASQQQAYRACHSCSSWWQRRRRGIAQQWLE